MRDRIRVGLVFGGRSCEHEVSLSSARSVVGAIDRTRYEVALIHITREGEWRWLTDASAANTDGTNDPLALSGRSVPVLLGYPDGGRLLAREDDAPPPPELDVVFPLLHGPFGEDGTVQGLLELAGLPYVGSGVLGSAAGMDKAMMKRALRAEQLPVLDYLAVARREWRADPDGVRARAEAALGYPMFVKPANLGSSVGVHRIDGPDSFAELVEDAALYDTRVLIEAAAVNCHEIECAVLGNDEPQASVPGEIVPGGEFYDYDAKYIDDTSESIIPAPLPAAVSERVRELSLAAFRAVDARGLARVDFFVERGGERRVFLNEVNTMPGFTPISMYPKMWEASGVAYPELIDRLIRLAIEEHRERRDVRAVL